MVSIRTVFPYSLRYISTLKRSRIDFKSYYIEILVEETESKSFLITRRDSYCRAFFVRKFECLSACDDGSGVS